MDGHRWRHWVAVLSVVGALLLVGATLTALWRYATHDRPEVIDHPLVVRTTNAACLVMRTTVHQLAPPPEAQVAQRLAAVEAQNSAVAEMLARIRALGSERVAGDAPSPPGSATGSRSASEAGVCRVASVGAAPALPGAPRRRGEPITTRMNDVGLDCTVPRELTSGG